MSWWERARCAEVEHLDVDAWFANTSTLEQRLQRRAAEAECAVCPVALECRRYALEAGEDVGLWGGLWMDEQHADQEVA